MEEIGAAADGVESDFGEQLRGGVTRFDLKELARLGEVLDRRPGILKGRSTVEFLAESMLKVRGKDGQVLPLRANRVQREFERRRGAGNIVLKARQMGLTTWIAGRFLLKTVTRPGTLTLLVAHTQQAAEEMLNIVHRMVEHLPAGLVAGALKPGNWNKRQIVFQEIDSEFRVESAENLNAGRGMTYQNLHCTEVARWGAGSSSGVDAREVLAGLRAGLSPGGEMVLESTPNGAEGCFYEQWRDADEIGLVRHFFPWWMEAGYRGDPVDPETLTGEERELVTSAGSGTGPGTGLDGPLDLAQIGFRRQLRAGMQGLARQEYAEDAESCFLVSGESYFDLNVVEARLKELPLPMETRKNGRLEIWFPPVPRKWYLVAVDPAGGGSEGDLSAIEVIDLETGMQCAEFAGHVGGLELMEIAREIGWDYGTAWLVVERNNHGSEQLGLLGLKGYLRIFQGSDGQAGLLTTSMSKPQMLAGFSLALAETPGLFYSRKLLAECRTFVRLRSGGLGARNGAHDDRVMAMAMGLRARQEILGRQRFS